MLSGLRNAREGPDNIRAFSFGNVGGGQETHPLALSPITATIVAHVFVLIRTVPSHGAVVAVLSTHLPMLLAPRSSHLAMLFPASFRAEVPSTVVVVVSRVHPVLPVAESMDLGDPVSAKLRREVPLVNPHPPVPVVGSAIPAAAVEVIAAIVIKKIVGNAHRHAEAELGRIEEVGRLGDDYRRPADVDTEVDVCGMNGGSRL